MYIYILWDDTSLHLNLRILLQARASAHAQIPNEYTASAVIYRKLSHVLQRMTSGIVFPFI